MGPLKRTVDRNKTFTQPFVAAKANARHKGPSVVETRLSFRQGAFDKLKDQGAFRRPGSKNRHKM